MNAKSGFTLIELILVTLILGILAGMVTVNYVGRGEDARISRVKSDIVNLEQAIDLYAIDNNDQYPDSLEELAGGEREYLRRGVPQDPWGNDYVYENPGSNNPNRYDLYSLGPDETAGTEDDISNWDLD